jgi:hypothetical protein
MQEYDLYINPQKPSVGLYVLKGAGLPDLANPSEWVFDGTAAQVDLPPDLSCGASKPGVTPFGTWIEA